MYGILIIWVTRLPDTHFRNWDCRFPYSHLNNLNVLVRQGFGSNVTKHTEVHLVMVRELLWETFLITFEETLLLLLHIGKGTSSNQIKLESLAVSVQYCLVTTFCTYEVT